MENTSLYKFIGKVALEFRLSLENICIILGKERDEKTQMEVYEILKEIAKGNQDLLIKYNYLFFYETVNESNNMSKIAYIKAVNYIKRYNKVVKDNDQEGIRKILEELNKTEEEFSKIRSKFNNTILNEEDLIIISKYRMKHVLSREKFCTCFSVSRSSLEKKEKQMSDTLIKEKLKLLSEYFLQFENRRTIRSYK